MAEATELVMVGEYQLSNAGGQPLGSFQYDSSYTSLPHAIPLDQQQLIRFKGIAKATAYEGLHDIFRDVKPEGFGLDMPQRKRNVTSLSNLDALEYSPGDAIGALEVCTDIGDKTRFVRHTSQAMFKAMDELDPAQSSAHVVNKVEGTISASLGGKRPKMTVLHKLTCCTVSHTTSRDLNGALLRGLFLGTHTKCKTPSVDVQSVPRCMPLDHHDSQVYQKENLSALAFMGSLCRATTPF